MKKLLKLLNFSLFIVKGKLNRKPVKNLIDFRVKHVAEDKTYKKVIWFYWEQGLEQAPELIKKSYSNWVKMNPDYKVIFLEKNNLGKYLNLNVTEILEHSSVILGKAGQSDFIRLLLLYNHGGIWVDATTFNLKPLNEWLPQVCQDSFLFHFSQKEGRVPDRVLISWFLASNKGNPIVKDWLEKVCKYLFKERKYYLVMAKHELNSVGRVWGPEKTGYAYINIMESFGYVPYYWLFYLYNEVGNTVRKNKYMYCCSQISEEINEKTFVSKQTYRGYYVDSIDYQKRLKVLNERMKELGVNEG